MTQRSSLRQLRAVFPVMGFFLLTGLMEPCQAQELPTIPPRDLQARGAGPLCGTPVLAEQLRMRCFEYEVLARVIPGFADLEQEDGADLPSCGYVVYLTDRATYGDSARKVLDPILEEPGGQRRECGPGPITVRPSPSSFSTLQSLHNRVQLLLRDAGLAPRTSSGVWHAQLVIRAHNQRALEAARALVAEDSALASAKPFVELQSGPQEIDPPIRPPRAASLLVLDSLAARYASKHEFVVDIAPLPVGVTVQDLQSRGLRLKQVKDTHCSKRIIEFREPRQWEDGHLEFTVHEGGYDHAYDVWCKDQVCRMAYPPMPLPIDYIMCARVP